MIEAKRLAATLLDTVREWVEPAIRIIGERLNDFDARLKAIPSGPPGEKGESVKGDSGEPGKSAYQSAVERGFSGTEMQWLDSLQGRPGKDADPVVTRAMVESIEAKAPRQMIADMVDEISRGLSGFDDSTEALPEPALAALASSVSSLEKTMREPITPVYDDKGKIVAARRG